MPSLLAAANRDPAAFANPEALDLTSPDASKHVAFGFGKHFCIGNQLARHEGRPALGTLARRFPDLELCDADPEWCGTVMTRHPRQMLVALGREHLES